MNVELDIFGYSLKDVLIKMKTSDLKALSAANSRLPNHAYFAYEGIEVIEYNFVLNEGIELSNGKTISTHAILPHAFTLQFEDNQFIDIKD